MSYRPKGGRRGKGDPTYPGLWTDWIWSDQYQRYYRSRLTGPGPDEIEYEYQQPASTPRTTEETTLGPAPEGYSQSQDPNYTHEQADQTDTSKSSSRTSRSSSRTSRTSRSTASSTAPGQADIDTVTETFAQASISPSGGAYATPATYGATPIAADSGYQASAALLYSNVGSNAYAGPLSHSGPAYVSPSMGWQNHIRTRNPYTDREEFDPHYKVHGSWAFKWGKIFKVLWAEPKGAEVGGSSEQSGTSGSVTVRKKPGGKETFAKVRRFVIIKPMDGHCICLPILTYSGQGVMKRGVHAEHHAIIYSGKKPVAFRGEKEKGLEMRSIKVTPDNPRHKLDDASRLNYAKTYTVEYNVKVWFIGRVSGDSEWQIRTDYNRVHPPLEIKGVQPPDTPGDTYDYAEGGTTSGYPGYTAPYTSGYQTGTSYPASSGAAFAVSLNPTQSAPSYNAYGNPTEGVYAASSRSSHFPASTAYQHSTDPQSAGYGTHHDSSTVPPSGYGSGVYPSAAASSHDRPLDNLEEVDEGQHHQRSHSSRPPPGSERQGDNDDDLYDD